MASSSIGRTVSLTLRASNAAYDYSAHAPVSSSATKTIDLDNQPVALSLCGPSDAPASAGTQYLIASASAGAERDQFDLLLAG